MTVNGAFWRYLKLQRNKDAKWYILTVFETIWNYREFLKKEDGKLWLLTVFETIWNYRDHLETRTLSRALWHILKRYLKQLWDNTCSDFIKGSWNRPCVRNPGFRDWCILTLFETIGISENLLKIRTVNGAFCRYLIGCFDLQGKFWKQYG